MKVAVAGAGALGGRVGTSLFKAGYDVTFIDLWEENVAAIRENGMEVQTETDLYTVDVPVIFPHEIKESYDLIVVLTKAMHSLDMLKQLKKYGAISEDTAVLTMMNGLGHDERLSQVVNEDQVYLAVSMWTAGLRGPGKILLEGDGGVNFKRMDGKDSELTHQIKEMFNNAKLNAEIYDDIYLAVWEKAVVNSVVNPLCTILDKRVGELGAYEKVNEMISPLIQEIVDVANARGVALDFDFSLEKITSSFPDHVAGLHYPSMYQDFANKRPTEIDYLNGAIAQYGDEKNVPTPLNKMITHMIHQLEMKH